jgi:RHS repeat-associated protein
MRTKHSLGERFFAILLVSLLVGNMAACTGPTLSPRGGWADFDLAMIRVPGGWVHAGGGNLLVHRSDLSMDTLLGTQEITATYNSSPGEWTFSIGVRYDGASFRDPTGLTINFENQPDGSMAPGTYWMKVDGDTLQTKGGLRYDFDATGQLEAVYWYTFDYPRIRYQHAPGQTRIDQCTAPGVCTGVFVIDLEGDRPVRVRDARTGRIAEYRYAGGLLVNAKSAFETEAGLPGTTYEYDGTLLAAQTSSEDERIEYEYSVGGRIDRVVQIGEGNPTHRFSHHSIDRNNHDLYRTLYINPLGGKLLMFFDGERKLHEVRWLDSGDTRRITWISKRRIASDRLPNGARTTYRYGYIGWDPIQVTTASGNVLDVTYAYYSLNLDDPTARAIRRVEDSLGTVFEMTYDSQGRPVSRVNGAGESISTSYGFSVFPDAATSPSGITTSFPLYGIHGHWTDSEGPLADKRGFDPVGNLRIGSRNLRSPGLVSRDFDAGRRVSKWNVAATEGGVTTSTGEVSIVRRSDGQPLAITRPGGGDHEFQYDALGRATVRSERVDGVWREARFGHDAAGNPTSFELPNGMRQELEYDVYGRLVRHRALQQGVLEGERVLSYRAGQLETSWDSIRNTTEVHSYDLAGRPVVIAYGAGDQLVTAYDVRGRVTGETLLLGTTVLANLAYGHDLADRLASIQDLEAGETLVEIAHGDGRAEEIRYGNGLTRTVSYDPITGELTGAVTRDGSESVVATTTLRRTTEIGPLRQQVRAEVETPLASTIEEYWLTLSDQLSDPGTRLFAWNNGSEARSFNHDRLANRTDSEEDSFLYNEEGNRLLSADLDGSVITYVYDAAGFVVSRNGTPVTWSATGQMTSFGDASATWDMSGRIVNLELAGAVRSFDLFGGRIASDIAAGTIGRIDLGHVVLDLAGTERVFRHADFRGNVSFISNEDGEVVAHYRYRPYGLDQVFGSDDGFQFMGKVAVGPLLLMGARVYDSEAGRFLSPDPVLQPRSQYAYTTGNPVSFMDISGLDQGPSTAEVIEAGGSIGAIGAGLAAVGVGAGSGILIGLGLAVAGFGLGLIVAALVGAAIVGHRKLAQQASSARPATGHPALPPSTGAQPNGSNLTNGPPPAGISSPQLGCSPAQLSRAPDASGALRWLLLVNLLLGLMVIHFKVRRTRDGRSTPSGGDLDNDCNRHFHWPRGDHTLHSDRGFRAPQRAAQRGYWVRALRLGDARARAVLAGRRLDAPEE